MDRFLHGVVRPFKGEFKMKKKGFRSHLFLITLTTLSCTKTTSQSGVKTQDDIELIKEISAQFFQPELAFGERGIGVTRSPGGAVYLFANSCERVSQTVNAFLELRKKWEPDFAGLNETPQPKSRPSGWCEIKLDRVMPPLVANTFGKEIDDNSSEINCWSHALALTGVMPGMTVASADTFTYAMESSQCQEVPATGELQPGDILSYRFVERDPAKVTAQGIAFEEQHAAVFLTKDLYLSKQGAGEYAILPPSVIADVWLTEEDKLIREKCEKRKDSSTPASEIQACDLMIQAHRCSPRAPFLASKGEATPHFDKLKSRLEPATWHVAIEQMMFEEGVSEVIPNGLAFISRKIPDFVGNHLFLRGEDIPRSLQNEIRKMQKSPEQKLEYNLNLPIVPTWPADVEKALKAVPNDPENPGFAGEKFEIVTQYLTDQLNQIAKAIVANETTLTSSDKYLLELHGLYLLGAGRAGENQFETLSISLNKHIKAK